MSKRATQEMLFEVFRKVLPEGRLNRIPRNPAHREVVLSVLCLQMQRRYPYSETEINDYLKGALRKLNTPVDHVTCRRYMVDLGFVKRDRAGTRYFLNYPKVEATLSEEAMTTAADVISEVREEIRKLQRKRKRA